MRALGTIILPMGVVVSKVPPSLGRVCRHFIRERGGKWYLTLHVRGVREEEGHDRGRTNERADLAHAVLDIAVDHSKGGREGGGFNESHPSL